MYPKMAVTTIESVRANLIFESVSMMFDFLEV